MILKEKLTKKIWYQNELWKLEKVFSPNKFDDYLLLSHPSKSEIHSEGIIPVIMILIDAHNDTFYPNIEKVRKTMKVINQLNDQREKLISKHQRYLTDQWLSCFRLIDEG